MTASISSMPSQAPSMEMKLRTPGSVRFLLSGGASHLGDLEFTVQQTVGLGVTLFDIPHSNVKVSTLGVKGTAVAESSWGGNLGLGLEIGASFLRSGGSGENGIVIIPALVTARVYPRERSPFHFRLGGGGVSWQDNNQAGTRAKGLAWEAGIGYDVRLTTYGYLTPFVLYQEGRPGSTRMRALLVGAAYGRW